ncbi:MAG: hypothetical protein DRQ55_09025 [Planctomycetota bacterium]|nr:MAG: hypothetical protein DRQ55_09025 [Planctomycetota bacterium]
MSTTDSAQTRHEAHEPLDRLIARVGGQLSDSLAAILAELPEGSMGPQRLAKALGLDKVLLSRLLKALRSADPIAVAYHAPGPDPLRRFLRAARKGGASAACVERGEAAVSAFDDLIRGYAGDRSSLAAMISAWLPEARAEFELRRKQAAHRAMSELKGVAANLNLGVVFLHPSKDGKNLDVVWLVGLLGITRLRPDAPIKVTTRLSTRRFADMPLERRPTTLAGEHVDNLEGLRLDQFCLAPPAQLEVSEVGTTVHYLLAGEEFGPRSAVDLLLAEVNLGEMPAAVAPGSGRLGYVFVEVGSPSRTLVFDVIVHEDVYAGRDPKLLIYDTSLDGVADVNDRARDVDRVDMVENIASLGKGAARFRSPDVPRYQDLLTHVFEHMGWDGAAFRGYRCHIDFPIYGSQVAMAFEPPEG